ncbi:MAG: cytochrome c, partial [Verrucomicrobiota bacterium]
EGLDLSGNANAQALVAGTLKVKPDKPAEEKVPGHLSKAEKIQWKKGLKVFNRDAHCGTCHGADGVGAVPNIYPPLVESRWVTGSAERLIKLTLHGLWGPIEVKGKIYDPKNGIPPMTAFGGLLKDDEIADVLTYVRNAWGNKGSAVSTEDVKKIRKETTDRGPGMWYKPAELLKEHPHP